MHWLDSQDRCGTLAPLHTQEVRARLSASVLAHRKSHKYTAFGIPVKAQGFSNPENELYLQAWATEVSKHFVTQRNEHEHQISISTCSHERFQGHNKEQGALQKFMLEASSPLAPRVTNTVINYRISVPLLLQSCIHSTKTAAQLVPDSNKPRTREASGNYILNPWGNFHGELRDF